MLRRATFTVVLCALLGGGTAFSQERGRVATLLADHAVALGDPSTLRSLGARSQVSLQQPGGRKVTHRAETLWNLKGDAVRTYALARGLSRTEYYSSEGAFVRVGASLGRFRRETQTSRSGAYLFRTLANPFPLRPFLTNPARARRLSAPPKSPPGTHALVLAPDTHDVGVTFLLDAKTHLLQAAIYSHPDHGQFLALEYRDYRKVAGAFLPHRIAVKVAAFYPDRKTGRLNLSRSSRDELVERYFADAKVPESFAPPSPKVVAQKGLQRRVSRTGPEPRAAGAGDLDGDGQLDIAVACYGGLAVHFGGSKKPFVFVRLGSSHHGALAVADVDLDGRPEALVVSHTRPAEVLYRVAFDEARAPSVHKVHGAPRFATRLRVQDLDRDGIPDLVFGGRHLGAVHVKYGNGRGGFRLLGLAPRVPKPQHPFDVAAGDLQGDGLTDLAVADGKYVRLMTGTRLGTFRSLGRPLDPKGYPVAAVLVDLNEDGLDDLVLAHSHPLVEANTANLQILLNTGKGLEFGSAAKGGGIVDDLVKGDFDGDGHWDVACNSAVRGQVVVLHGDGKGKLERRMVWTAGRGCRGVAAADVNGDGRDDCIAVNRADDSITILSRPAPEPDPRPRVRPAPTIALSRGADEPLAELRHGYRFAGLFAVPDTLTGLASLRSRSEPGLGQLVALGSGGRTLRRITLLLEKDPSRSRLVLGPTLPLRNAKDKTDVPVLAGLGIDLATGTVFSLEGARSLRSVSLFGHLLERAEIPAAASGAVACRRGPDGSLYLFLGDEAGLRRYRTGIGPLRLEERDRWSRRRGLGGMDVVGDSAFLATRTGDVEERALGADGSSRVLGQTSLAALLRSLAIGDPVVTGLAVDGQSDLWVAVAADGKTHLLWFRAAKSVFPERVAPERIKMQYILVSFAKAKRSENGRDRNEALRLAREILRKARGAESFLELWKAHGDGKGRHTTPPVFAVADDRTKPVKGEIVRRNFAIPPLIRAAFALEPGEVGFCEYDPKQAPHGYYIVRRIR